MDMSVQPILIIAAYGCGCFFFLCFVVTAFPEVRNEWTKFFAELEGGFWIFRPVVPLL